MLFAEFVHPPRGEVTLELTDDHGIFVARRHANLIVTQMREQIADWATQDFTEKIDEIAIGGGGHDLSDPNIPIPPTESDTALEILESLKTVTSVTQPDSLSAQFSVAFTTADVTDPTSITEAGLFTDPGTIMVARVTFPELIVTGILTLTVTWKLIF